jgi:hypothetical protein
VLLSFDATLIASTPSPKKTTAKKLGAAVMRQMTGKHQTTIVSSGITADSLKQHCAAISSDPNYTNPLLHRLDETAYLSEWKMFIIFDRLKPTASGSASCLVPTP